MLEGQLVRLRAVEREDLERDFTWINDREVTQYLIARYPISRAAEETWLQDRAAKMPGFEDIMLAIETKDGVHIGNCGLHRGRPEDRWAELGIMIGEKEYWSNGYGSDAVRTLTRFGFQQMNLNRIELGVLEFNERAQACYRKCGFTEEGRQREAYYQDGRYWDIVRMSILRREWEALFGNER